MTRVLKAGFAFFLLVFALGFILGTIRVLLLARSAQEHLARYAQPGAAMLGLGAQILFGFMLLRLV